MMMSRMPGWELGISIRTVGSEDGILRLVLLDVEATDRSVDAAALFISLLMDYFCPSSF